MDLMLGDYHLVSDSNQFTLYHITKSGEKAKNPGMTVENFVGHYPTIESAFKALPSRMLQRSSATTLREVADLLERYRLLIEMELKGA